MALNNPLTRRLFLLILIPDFAYHSSYCNSLVLLGLHSALIAASGGIGSHEFNGRMGRGLAQKGYGAFVQKNVPSVFLRRQSGGKKLRENHGANE